MIDKEPNYFIDYEQNRIGVYKIYKESVLLSNGTKIDTNVLKQEFPKLSIEEFMLENIDLNSIFMIELNVLKTKNLYNLNLCLHNSELSNSYIDVLKYNLIDGYIKNSPVINEEFSIVIDQSLLLDFKNTIVVENLKLIRDKNTDIDSSFKIYLNALFQRQRLFKFLDLKIKKQDLNLNNLTTKNCKIKNN